MNHLTSRHRQLLAYDFALRQALDEVLGLTAAFAGGVYADAGRTGTPDGAGSLAESGTHAEAPAEAQRTIARAASLTGDTDAFLSAVDPLYGLLNAAAEALLPTELCERLLGGMPTPAQLPGAYADWLESAGPSPLDAALVLYAAGAHIGLPELGRAGQRRTAEALDKFRVHYAIAEHELLANLSQAAVVWSPARYWLGSAAAWDERLTRVRELPDRLRDRTARAEAARRGAEERSRALGAETDDLAGRLDRLRRENEVLRATADRLRGEVDALRSEAARATILEAQLARLRARESDTRARLRELEEASALDSGVVASASEGEEDGDPDVDETPDLSTVYLLLLHSNDKDNTPAEVRDELLARGIGHVEVQRIDESRVPTSFPRGAVVAIDASFMSHPVAEKAYDNATTAGAPVFRFTKLGPARLHRRLTRFLRERSEAGTTGADTATPGLAAPRPTHL